jgi:hypothetical protein
MTIRRFAPLVAALAAVCPAVSNAWPAKAPLDACVNAFAKTLAPADQASHVFKVVYGRQPWASSIADYYQTSFTFELWANDRKSGAVLARARCSADRHGGVALTSLLDSTQTPARVAQR